jgi:predicted peptidase
MSNGLSTRHTFQSQLETTLHCQYLLHLPSQYSESDQPWPLLLFLHGSGERGSNLTKVTAHGPPKLAKRQRDFPFVLVSPQCPAGQWWSNFLLLPLLDEVVAKHRVDPARVYVTGMSMGGYGAWNLALEYPERFAAVAPVCGGGDLLTVLLASPRKLRALRSLGVWAFHGSEDPIVPASESERMVRALRQVGNDAQLTIYPHTGHDSWTETYRNTALYTWLLEHRRRRHHA